MSRTDNPGFFKDLRACIAFITILPTGKNPVYSPVGMIRFFPVVGLIIGTLLVITDVLASMVWPAPAAALVDLIFLVAVTGAFHMSGQVCTSTERIYAVDAVHDAFVEAFVAETRRLRIGNGLDKSEIGPLVSEAARDKVERLVADATAKGATIACGGKRPEDRNTGWFYEPTILTGCTPEMDVLNEEAFGPVVAIMRVPDFETALNGANATRFGLGASIFTTDLAEAHEASERLESGMVWINNPLIDNDALPFGGWKASGLGRELGRMGLDTFRRSKMVILDHKPVRHDWWYPYPDDWFLESGGRKHA